MQDWGTHLQRCLKLGIVDITLRDRLDEILSWYSGATNGEDDLANSLIQQYGEHDFRVRFEEFLDRLVITADDGRRMFPGSLSEEEAKTRYRKLIRVFHPDRGANDEAWLNYRAEQVNLAFEGHTFLPSGFAEAQMPIFQAKAKTSRQAEPGAAKPAREFKVRYRPQALRDRFGDPKTLQRKIVYLLAGFSGLLILFFYASTGDLPNHRSQELATKSTEDLPPQTLLENAREPENSREITDTLPSLSAENQRVIDEAKWLDSDDSEEPLLAEEEIPALEPESVDTLYDEYIASLDNESNAGSYDDIVSSVNDEEVNSPYIDRAANIEPGKSTRALDAPRQPRFDKTLTASIEATDHSKAVTQENSRPKLRVVKLAQRANKKPEPLVKENIESNVKEVSVLAEGQNNNASVVVEVTPPILKPERIEKSKPVIAKVESEAQCISPADAVAFNGPQNAKVTVAGLRLRIAPEVGCRVLLVLSSSNPVKRLKNSVDGLWAYIEATNKFDTKVRGWVSSRYLVTAAVVTNEQAPVSAIQVKPKANNYLEIKEFMNSYKASYEAGDLNAFARLHLASARENKLNGLKRIRKSYEGFFRSTSKRDLDIEISKLDQDDSQSATITGVLRVTVKGSILTPTKTDSATFKMVLSKLGKSYKINTFDWKVLGA